MKLKFLAAASAIALVNLSAPAAAQHMHMPGMTMPAAPKPAAKKPAEKARPKKKAAAKRAGKARAIKPAASPAKSGESMPGMDHGAMPMPPQSEPSAAAEPMDHSQMNHGAMNMPTGEHAGHMATSGALGPYPMERESSGTAWQPDASQHQGLMKQSGDWMLMAHGVLNLVYDHQSGRRGDDQAFASGMLMGMAQRRLGNGTLQFKAMFSTDHLMGPRGYHLLLASG